MFVIRSEQMALLEADAQSRFVLKMVMHAREQFPRETSARTDADIEAQIRSDMVTARTYGLQSEYDVCRFLNLSLLLGADFIEHPNHGWMRSCLSDASIATAGGRMAALMREVARRLHALECGGDAGAIEIPSAAPDARGTIAADVRAG